MITPPIRPPHTPPVPVYPPIHGGPILAPEQVVYEVTIGTYPPATQTFRTIDEALQYVRGHFSSRDHTVTITASTRLGR